MRTRTRYVRQVEEADCGAACLAAVLSWHGRHVPWPRLQQVCGGGRDGLSGATLIRAAAHYGLSGAGKRVRLTGQDATDLAGLRMLPTPAIVFTGGSHFAVLEHVDARGRVSVNDPATGRRRMRLAEFRADFSGVAITFTPTADFVPGGQPETLRRAIAPWLRERPGLLAAAAAVGALGALFGVGTALLIRFVVLALARSDGLGGLFLAMAVAAVGMFGAAWAQQRLQSALLRSLSVARSRRLMATLLTLPGAYFHRRFTGAVAARAQIGDTIAFQLTGVAVPALTSGVTLAAALIAVGWLAPLLALLALAGTVPAVLVVRAAAARDESRQSLLAAEQAERDGEVMSGLSMIETVKAEGSLARLFDRWAVSHARSMSVAYQSMIAARRVLGVATTLNTCAAAAVVGLGAVLVAHGRLPLADLAAVVTLVGTFQAASGALARAWLDLGQLRSSFAIYADVARATPTTGVSEQARHMRRVCSDTPNGRLVLRGVTFGYDTNRPAVVRDVSLELAAGRRLVVVGSSGSGKSTLAKLIVGAAEPWTGKISLGGDAPSIGYVSQQPLLFEGSVAENITFGADVDAAAVDTALAAACLDQVITRRGGPWRAQVAQHGQNFSGGERQRLALARALCRRPALLVLDEATSALEGPLAQRVDQNIRRLGITTVVIAHRLGAVHDDDLVLVLHDGTAQQLGAHHRLSATDGRYRTLLGAAR